MPTAFEVSQMKWGDDRHVVFETEDRAVVSVVVAGPKVSTAFEDCQQYRLNRGKRLHLNCEIDSDKEEGQISSGDD